ncbi:hypothetical protein GCM10009544_63570 [Streptomyces stramineus]|uniref:HAD family hydrolase n=1 Tax=Streptomyces stramineus TaxID=173861 RepID=A0ABN1BC81_9ACTN
MRVAIAGNQTPRVGELLRAMNLPADAIAVSGEWGVAKPDVEFFTRVTSLVGVAPERTVYVGDHPANDCVPAAAAGLRAVHLRRGPSVTYGPAVPRRWQRTGGSTRWSGGPSSADPAPARPMTEMRPRPIV